MINKSVLVSIFVACVSILSSGVAYSADNIPKFTCSISDKVNADDSVIKKTTFEKTTPMIYFVCVSENVVKGQSVKSVWIADDTNNVAPANYKIDEKAIPVDKELGNGEYWTGKFSLSIPDKGWPIGKYHVALYVDDQLAQSQNFIIE